MLELLGGKLELLLGFELDEEPPAELLLGGKLELLLGFELDEETTAELELGANGGLLPPPLSSPEEHEKVKAKANPRVAASRGRIAYALVLVSCVLIVYLHIIG
jgi:hypothetical protein